MPEQNFLTTAAVNRLYQQAVSNQRFAGMSADDFGTLMFNGQTNVRPKQLSQGPDTGKLTLEERSEDGTWVNMRGITPVDCYNLLPAGKTVDDFVGVFGHYAMLILPNVQPAAQTPTY